jgi:hypothetical protein
MVRPLRSLPPRRSFLLAAALVIAIAVVVIAIGALTAAHPNVSRQQAIAAVVGSNTTGRKYPRVEAKYMHRSDVEKALGSHPFAPDTYVWVVAISGDWGSRGEIGRGPVTSALVVIEDRPGFHLLMRQSSTTDSWPSIFERLPDLANPIDRL